MRQQANCFIETISVKKTIKHLHLWTEGKSTSNSGGNNEIYKREQIICTKFHHKSFKHTNSAIPTSTYNKWPDQNHQFDCSSNSTTKLLCNSTTTSTNTQEPNAISRKTVNDHITQQPLKNAVKKNSNRIHPRKPKDLNHKKRG